MNGHDVDHVQRQIDKHIVYTPGSQDTPATGHFNADRRMNSITTGDLTAYAASRLKQGYARASVNHELATIRRAFRLALKGGDRDDAADHIPMLTLNNARTGFLERDQFDAHPGAPARLPARAVDVHVHHRLAQVRRYSP